METFLLSDLLRRFQNGMGQICVVELDEHHLIIRPGGESGSVVSIAVADPDRPMYTVIYEFLSSKAMVVADAQTQTSLVLFEGLQWIVEAVRNHGYVIPEFPHPRLVKSLKSAAREAADVDHAPQWVQDGQRGPRLGVEVGIGSSTTAVDGSDAARGLQSPQIDTGVPS